MAGQIGGYLARPTLHIFDGKPMIYMRHGALKWETLCVAGRAVGESCISESCRKADLLLIQSYLS